VGQRASFSNSCVKHRQGQKGIVHSTKLRKRVVRERFTEGLRVIYDFNPIYKAAELAMYARVQ
jgi:hypothetical protein